MIESSRVFELYNTVDSNFVDGVRMVFASGERKELVDPFFKLGFAGREVA